MAADDSIRTIAQGESIESLAYFCGLRPSTIWNHAQNAHLREGGRTEDVLKPGDEVFLPALRARVETRATEARHRFIRETLGSRLHVRFIDDTTPRANAPYSLSIDGQDSIRGTTDGGGYLDHLVSPLARLGVLHFDSDPEDVQFELRLGHLDPVTTPSGVQQRLRNLGFFWGEDTEEFDEETSLAIASFQRSRALEPSGDLDAAARAALIEVHGS